MNFLEEMKLQLCGPFSEKEGKREENRVTGETPTLNLKHSVGHIKDRQYTFAAGCDGKLCII